MLKKYNNDLENLSPQEALDILLEGNVRFTNGISINKNFLSRVQETGSTQKPFAAIVSCIDSRAPVEIIFDQGIGDVFSVRLAGNVISDNVLGSLEFAAALSGVKLIMVLGHTNCGAIKGAIDQVEMGYLTQLLKKIEPAVEKQSCHFEKRDSKDKKLVEAVAVENVKLCLQEIKDQSDIIAQMVNDKKLLLIPALYCVETGTVSILNQENVEALSA